MAWVVDTQAAHAAWNSYIQAKRKRLVVKRPVADLLIGGFAMRYQGLITRNRADFCRWFPRLNIEEP